MSISTLNLGDFYNFTFKDHSFFYKCTKLNTVIPYWLFDLEKRDDSITGHTLKKQHKS